MLDSSRCTFGLGEETPPTPPPPKKKGESRNMGLVKMTEKVPIENKILYLVAGVIVFPIFAGTAIFPIFRDFPCGGKGVHA